MNQISSQRLSLTLSNNSDYSLRFKTVVTNYKKFWKSDDTFRLQTLQSLRENETTPLADKDDSESYVTCEGNRIGVSVYPFEGEVLANDSLQIIAYLVPLDHTMSKEVPHEEFIVEESEESPLSPFSLSIEDMDGIENLSRTAKLQIGLYKIPVREESESLGPLEHFLGRSR